MIAFRKQHPSLARSRFWREEVRWFGPRGVADLSQPAVGWCLHGGSQQDRDLYVLVNAGTTAVSFVLQEDGATWHLAVDTARPAPDDIDITAAQRLPRPSYVVEARSVVVLVRG